MASCSSLLSEEQFICSICLEVFIDPVTTPCGHNFCKACITRYWDTNNLYQCPLCIKHFDRRPELHVNTTFRDVVEKNKKIREKEVRVGPGEIPCDFCTGWKRKALKSCLVCQTSHCETHLEPHQRVGPLKKHKLINPVENLEDRMCKKHERPLEMFCRTDQTCVCQFCTEGDHKTHDTVPIEQDCEERKSQMKKTEGEVQHLIRERLEKVQEIKGSVDMGKKDAEREIHSVRVFTTLPLYQEKEP